MKSGFTLIEILVALVIVGILVGTAVVSFGAGIRSAKMADATRAVQQYAGHARAIALLKQRPVVLTIEEVFEDGEFSRSRITTTYGKDAEAEAAGASGGAGFGVGGAGGRVTTLSGISVDSGDAGGEDEAEDPLSSEPRDFEGIHVRGTLKEETEERRTRISVFSTADLLLRRSREQKEKNSAKREDRGETNPAEDGGSVRETDEETKFSVVYEPNGRCDPYVVKIWKDGGREEDAVELQVSRFGKVIEEEER